MKLGITGTRDGWNDNQEQAFRRWLWEQPEEFPTQLHHGDCVGVDAQVTALIQRLFGECKIHCHPPLDPKLRAFMDSDYFYEPKDYIVRNHNIVDACDALIVIPKTQTEIVRSGTWASYRYALNRGDRFIAIIWPSGNITQEGDKPW